MIRSTPRFLPLSGILILVALGSTTQAGGGDEANQAEGPREVSFTTADGGRIVAHLYGRGDHAVVLAHGATFNKESWSEQARMLEQHGLCVLAIDFRGYGKSQPGSQEDALYLDVLAAVRYLHDHGAKRVSVVGGSMGGRAAAQAAVEAKEGEIDHLILLAHAPIRQPQKIKGKKLFLVARGDRLMPSVREQYEAAPQPKRLVILDGNAHAQHIFRTPQGEALLRQILEELTGKSAER